MARFNVPFLPDEEYTEYLVSRQERIQSIHFPLYDNSLKDARIDLDQKPLRLLIDQLKQLKNQKKYLLANARIHSSSVYSDKQAFTALAPKLERLLNEEVIEGLIFADGYMLMAFGKALPSIAKVIEAIPSINFAISSVDQLHVLFEMIDTAGFKQPAKITLDRKLNRRPQQLSQVIGSIRKSYPALTLELLANEGCLSHCPFRATHECMISMANLLDDSGGYDTHSVNTALACRNILLHEPHRFLASPFIRPEDTSIISDLGVDVIKLCGRTLGPQFLQHCLQSYFAGYYEGNLVELMDAANWMKQYVHIDNRKLPEDFYTILSSCDNNCQTCSTCLHLFEQASHPVNHYLPDLR